MVSTGCRTEGDGARDLSPPPQIVLKLCVVYDIVGAEYNFMQAVYTQISTLIPTPTTGPGGPPSLQQYIVYKNPGAQWV